MNEIQSLIEDNMKLVYSVINDLVYIPSKVEREDLEQEGRIALWKAVKTYGESKDCKLSTHCYRVIKSDIIDYLRTFQRKKRNGVIPDLEQTYSKDFEDEIISNYIIDEIKRHVGNVEAEMFVDKYANGLTYKDLEVKYGLSESAISNRMLRVKGTLKHKLKWGNFD